jgi:poly(3-hydroxybutyrate) depolymerase
MRKVLLATLCVGLPALVASCSNYSDEGQKATGGSSAASTSSSQGGSSGQSSSASNTPSGGSSTPASSSASGGSSSSPGGSSGGSSTVPSSGGKAGAGGSGTTSGGGKAGNGGSSTASGGSTSTGGSGTAGAGGGGSTSTGGTGTADRSGTGGTSGGGTTSTGGGTISPGGGYAIGNDPVPSKGCGKTDGLKTLTTGGSSVSGAPTTSTRLKGVKSGGKDRLVILDVPADYDPTKPYRLVFSWRQMGGSDTGNATGLHPAGDGPNFDAKSYAYFGLRREALNANQPAIFVAPDTDPAGSLWNYDKDVVYFDDLLKLLTENLCIDESRVFTTGFSYGAMMSFGLSNGRASKLRAAVTMAPSQFGASTPTGPIAYMSTTGMDDGTCRWGNETSGGEGCVMTHAKANGCTIPSTFPTAAKGSKKFVCYDFEKCKEGYPVKVCTFDGPHTPSSVDDGTQVGEDGLKAFIPPLAWKFMAQF